MGGPFMMFRLAVGILLLSMAGCNQTLLPATSAPAQTTQGQSELSASDSLSGLGTRILPLGRWQPLFERDYYDPAEIDAFLADLRADPGVRRTVLLNSTLTWGCPCPTWVFPFHDDMSELKHVMVLASPELALDPTNVASAELSFKMTGYFDGTVMTGLEWAESRGEAPPGYPKGGADDSVAEEYWADDGLVFVVETWCFDDDPLSDDAEWLRDQGAASCNP